MKIQIPTPPRLVLLCLFLSFLFSCSKDSDLLAEAILPDTVGNIHTLAVDDRFFIAKSNGSVILDIIGNDNTPEQEEVIIEDISDPTHGSAEVNEDNTVTYTPDPEMEEGEDSFSYTISTSSGTTGTGTVNIYLSEKNSDLGVLKAFPGAEGFGRNATGGRGGKVFEVTNLKDSGEGSLRSAVDASGPRTVVFKVSGYINLQSPLIIRNGNLTIAGQTAPGGGITLRNNRIDIVTSNIIIRYLRIRPGTNSPTNQDAIRILNGKENSTISDIIIDHCSISWAKDEQFSIVTNNRPNCKIRNVTVQNTIISEPIGSKYGVLVMYDVNDVSFYNNYLAHNLDRQFRASTSKSGYEVINNVIYNFGWGTQLSYGGFFDIIGNIYKAKNDQRGSAITYIPSGNTPEAKAESGLIHQSNNVVINNSSKYNETNAQFDAFNKSSRVFSHSLITPSSTSGLEDKVLKNVGANIFNDPVDQRVLNDYLKGSGGVISNETQVGGYPLLNELSRPTNYDTDKDGMPDSWELANGLNPNDSNDGKEIRPNMHYTNLEIFLHMLTL